jgi:hypothetical protein
MTRLFAIASLAGLVACCSSCGVQPLAIRYVAAGTKDAPCTQWTMCDIICVADGKRWSARFEPPGNYECYRSDEPK